MLPLDVAPLVKDFDLTPQLGPLTVYRAAAPVLNTLGEFASSAVVTHKVRPWCAHTASGRQLMSLPEADRNQETTAFYVQGFPLRCADDSHVADILLYNDRRWRVIRVDRYAAQGRVWFALAQLEDTQQPS
jgi:hypothetical protein